MKYLSIWALALTMAVPAAQMQAVEKDPTGVYRIATPQDLVEFAAIVNDGYTNIDAKLVADLNMSGVKYSPIGSSTASYQGTFDGQGYTIDNLVVENRDKEGQGIFGYVNNATILNLVAGPNNKIYGSAFVGGIVGDKVGDGIVTLRGCGNEGAVFCTNQNGAGLGLALCQRIAELHATKLEYVSELGVGTTVRILVKGGAERAETAGEVPME